jgi:hypothetical protein
MAVTYFRRWLLSYIIISPVVKSGHIKLIKTIIMKSYKLASVLILSGFFLFSACKKDNGVSSQSSFKYKLTTTNRSNVVNRLETGNITWSSGYGSANMVKFEAKNSSGTQVEFKTSVSQKIDLFTSVASILGTVTLTPGTYSEIEFKGELAPNAPDAALELNGTFTSGATTTPVVFTVNSPLEIKTEKNNVVISDNASYTALTTFDLLRFTTGITEAMLNSATRTSGKIIISATSNTNLYNIMLANLDGCDDVQFDHD